MAAANAGWKLTHQHADLPATLSGNNGLGYDDCSPRNGNPSIIGAPGESTKSLTGWRSRGDSKHRCPGRLEVLRKVPGTGAILRASSIRRRKASPSLQAIFAPQASV